MSTGSFVYTVEYRGAHRDVFSSLLKAVQHLLDIDPSYAHRRSGIERAIQLDGIWSDHPYNEVIVHRDIVQ